MGLFDSFKRMFSSDHLDVSSRFALDRHAFTGTMSNFRVAKEIATGKTFGLKFLDKEKTKLFEDRFPGLKKPSEAEIGLQFDHPRIVKTYDHGLTTNGEQYILMEFIPGNGLNTVLAESPERLEGHRLSLFKQMAEALGELHRVGFIHRDICPRNFIVAPDYKTLKLIDFGLTLPDKPEFRTPGNRTGTPLYMAPEIVRRRATDKRVDLFALGVTGYRLLAIEHPWGITDTTGKAALNFDTHDPKPLLEANPKLDKRLAQTVMSCLSANADQRPDDAESILRALRKVESEYASPSKSA